MKREADHGSQLFWDRIFLGLGLQSFTPERLCCQAEKMAEGLASPALLLSAHLGPCTGTCVPCARGPELLCLGARAYLCPEPPLPARVRRGQGLMPPA